MKKVIKIHPIFLELLTRGYTDLTYLKVEDAIRRNDFTKLTEEERKGVKDLLTEITENINSTIKSI